MPDVRMPDGTIIRNVPDGTSRAAIQGRYDAHRNANKPTSFWSGVGDEIRHVAHNVDSFASTINPLDRALHFLAPNTRLDPDYTRTRVNTAEQRKVNARPDTGSTFGKIVGGTLATLPALLVPGGIMAQGAVMGGMQTDAHDAVGVARDMAEGAVLGKVAHVAGKYVGGVVGGKNISKSAKLLHDEGVTLTPGQLGGKNSVRQVIEDKVLGSIPGLSSIPDAAAANGANDLRVAVANRVLKKIGASVPAKTPINSATIGGIKNTVYGAYDNAAGKLTLTHDPDLVLGVNKIINDAPSNMLPDEATFLANKAKSIGTMLTNGPATGDTVKHLLGDLRGAASGYHGPLSKGLWNLHDEFSNALERQNPADLTRDFTAARSSVSLLKRFENAASRPGVDNGEFGTTHLRQAAEKRGFGTTDSSVADKTAPLMDIASAAAEVMRNKTANSGTIPRGMAVKALGSGGLSLAGLGMVHPVAAAALGTQLLGYVPGVAEILQKLALNRAPVFQQAGRAIEKGAPLYGMVGAAAGPKLLGQ